MSDFSFLLNPFDGITGGNTKMFEDKCNEIAKDLFNNYCISIGNNTRYYFAEIEFYYWENEKWNDDWNRVTYPRDKKEAGQLLYHSSGIDICFNSSYGDKKFGGILIRAIKDQNDVVTAGPLVCSQLILNSCSPKEMPKLEYTGDNRNVPVEQSIRSLGKKDMEKERARKDGLKLCFYDSSIGMNNTSNYDKDKIPEKNVWNPRRNYFDKNTGDIKIAKASYSSPEKR